MLNSLPLFLHQGRPTPRPYSSPLYWSAILPVFLPSRSVTMISPFLQNAATAIRCQIHLHRLYVLRISLTIPFPAKKTGALRAAASLDLPITPANTPVYFLRSASPLSSPPPPRYLPTPLTTRGCRSFSGLCENSTPRPRDTTCFLSPLAILSSTLCRAARFSP